MWKTLERKFKGNLKQNNCSEVTVQKIYKLTSWNVTENEFKHENTVKPGQSGHALKRTHG